MLVLMLDVVCPPGDQEYPVIVLLPEGVALADTVALLCEQLMLLEELATTDGVPVFDVTVTLPVAVQPLICVTVTE